MAGVKKEIAITIIIRIITIVTTIMIIIIIIIVIIVTMNKPQLGLQHIGISLSSHTTPSLLSI